MGSVYPRGGKLWMKYKRADGKWVARSTPFHLGQEKRAKDLLKSIEERVAAGQEIAELEGPITVAIYADKWLERRKALVADAKCDEGRLRHHVLPTLGPQLLAEVRPRHLVALFRDLRTKLAPATVRNVYSVVMAMFRDAVIDDLVESSPCILTKHHLGELEDKDPEWRATAVYSRDELEKLISDPRIPQDRQVFYALLGIAALRHGEAAGLCWRHYEPDLQPLGRLTVAVSYEKARTKTGRTRYMPVHPALAAMLAEWKMHGWPAMMGRKPGPDDLVVPMPEGPKNSLGKMRHKWNSWHRLKGDLETLELRHRRGHDLRRTMISLARVDGARADILELCTHNPRKRSSTVDLYTTFPWSSLCQEVAKLRISRRRGELIRLPKAMTANQPEGEFGTVLGTVTKKACIAAGLVVTPPGLEPGISA